MTSLASVTRVPLLSGEGHGARVIDGGEAPSPTPRSRFGTTYLVRRRARDGRSPATFRDLPSLLSCEVML